MRKFLIAAAVLPFAALAGNYKYHDAPVTVVSADMKAHTLTIKGDDGSTHTAPVEGNAMKELGNVKAGDKVTVTCKDTDKGEHLSVTEIKK